MAKKLKYDTEHFDFIVQWLDKEVKKIQKEIDKFGYVKIDKPADVYTYPEGYIASKVGGPTDYLLMKMDLAVSHITFKEKGYKKEIPWFFVVIDNHYKDLYLHPEDINRSVEEKETIVQLRPFNDEREKRNFMEYRMPVEAREYLSNRINKVYDEIRAYMAEHYGTEVKLGHPKYMGVNTVTDYFEKGKPEQYYEYFTNLIKRVNKDSAIGKHYRQHALNEYGLALTDEDIDNAEGKEFDGISKEQEELYAKQREEERIKKEEENAKKQKMIDDFTGKNKKEPEKKEKKWSRREEKLLDDILGIDKKQERREKRAKRKKNRSENPIKNILSGLATPFIWLGEKVVWCAKKVWSFITLIFGDLWAGIALVGRGIAKLFKSMFYGVDKSDVIFTVIPMIVSIVLVVLCLTKDIEYLTWAVETDGTLFGYDFEMSGWATNWFEGTDHGFFSAITLGLIQIVIILITFLLDLIVHLVFLVVALLWALLQFIIQILLVYVLPGFIPLYLLIRVIRGDNKGVTITALVISLICGIGYYALIFM